LPNIWHVFLLYYTKTNPAKRLDSVYKNTYVKSFIHEVKIGKIAMHLGNVTGGPAKN